MKLGREMLSLAHQLERELTAAQEQLRAAQELRPAKANGFATSISAAKIAELVGKFPKLGEDIFVHAHDYNQAANSLAAATLDTTELQRKLQSANEQLAHCNREREAAEAYASKWQAIVEGAGKELPKVRIVDSDGNDRYSPSHCNEITALEDFAITQVAGRKLVEKLLCEARQYVSDAGNDEDSETVSLSKQLLAAIDAALAAEGEKK